MRASRACWRVIVPLWGALAVWAGPARAQDICGGAGTLGVSRIVEIDTATGPRLGTQYHEHDILEDGEVVLTFDDGPLRAYSKLVLDALDAQCTKATFFVVGRMALADPDMVQEYVRRGHTVGAHTWSHANLAHLTPLRARTEIELGFSAVQGAMGKPIAPFFRFPYLSHPASSDMYLQSRHIATFSIDIDSKDYRTRDPAPVQRKVMADLAHLKKGIILFHDIQPSTAHALPGLLAELKAKGYRIVHVRPKGIATTLAAYDAIAQQELARKRTAATTEHPQVRRALTWPMATTGLAAQPAAAAPGAEQAPSGPPTAGRAQTTAGRVRREQDWGSTFWRLY
jgi:peptidoglycan-N-acetylglucosamine deacetylase